ncbi:hypothetical protein Afil01_56280 [Actinorhabdospora filicis]|uniref:Pentapeptide repeat-containing protein n=2 Tax=Actinorhabdospora filicis TaxID=1785913 RepID=A0A9W6SR67_9ACTN|nr:hypothetical protein Afil01_56280 [Actinorhabdospora filicis]
MVGAAVLAAGVSGWGIWWLFGSPDLSGPTDQASRFEVVKLILTVAGSFTAGLGAVIALVVQYRKQHLSEAGERREDTKLFLERYAKAAEQLGSDKAAVRLAGVYSMVSLADDWAEERQTCVDVLCAYIRMPYEPPSDADPEGMGERQVRHALLKALSQRVYDGYDRAWPRFRFDFTGAVIDGGVMARMAVPAHSEVLFDRARFTGAELNLWGAHVAGGVLSFDGAVIEEGARVDLSSMNVTHGVFRADGIQVREGVLDLASGRFPGGGLLLREISLEAGGEVRLTGARFGDTIGIGGVVDGGLLDFTRAEFGLRPGTGHALPQKIGPLDMRAGRLDFTGTLAERPIELGEVTFGGGTVDLRELGADTVVRYPEGALGLSLPQPRRPES